MLNNKVYCRFFAANGYTSPLNDVLIHETNSQLFISHQRHNCTNISEEHKKRYLVKLIDPHLQDKSLDLASLEAGLDFNSFSHSDCDIPLTSLHTIKLPSDNESVFSSKELTNADEFHMYIHILKFLRLSKVKY